jgi:hypothetical protein
VPKLTVPTHALFVFQLIIAELVPILLTCTLLIVLTLLVVVPEVNVISELVLVLLPAVSVMAKW